MDDRQRHLMLNLLRSWAEATDPEAPVVFGGRPCTANDYVAAVEKNTPLGVAYCAFMEAAAKQARRPLDEFLKDTIRPHTRQAKSSKVG